MPPGSEMQVLQDKCKEATIQVTCNMNLTCAVNYTNVVMGKASSLLKDLESDIKSLSENPDTKDLILKPESGVLEGIVGKIVEERVWDVARFEEKAHLVPDLYSDLLQKIQGLKDNEDEGIEAIDERIKALAKMLEKHEGVADEVRKSIAESSKKLEDLLLKVKTAAQQRWTQNKYVLSLLDGIRENVLSFVARYKNKGFKEVQTKKWSKIADAHQKDVNKISRSLKREKKMGHGHQVHVSDLQRFLASNKKKIAGSQTTMEKNKSIIEKKKSTIAKLQADIDKFQDNTAKMQEMCDDMEVENQDFEDTIKDVQIKLDKSNKDQEALQAKLDAGQALVSEAGKELEKYLLPI